MDLQLINPPELVKPLGYNHGIVAPAGKRILALSGQVGWEADGVIQGKGDLIAQFELSLINLKRVLEAAGGRVENIIQMRYFMVDVDAYRNNLKPLGVAYRRVFGKHFPAATMVGVTGLWDPDALCEIEAIAVLD